MKKDGISAGLVASGIETAWENVTASFERFCIATLTELMEQDSVELCGSRHERGSVRSGTLPGPQGAQRRGTVAAVAGEAWR